MYIAVPLDLSLLLPDGAIRRLAVIPGGRDGRENRSYAVGCVGYKQPHASVCGVCIDAALIPQ